jgi:hypothetical protein
VLPWKPFASVDPNGRFWEVPADAEPDGASIPQIVWIGYEADLPGK